MIKNEEEEYMNIKYKCLILLENNIFITGTVWTFSSLYTNTILLLLNI